MARIRMFHVIVTSQGGVLFEYIVNALTSTGAIIQVCGEFRRKHDDVIVSGVVAKPVPHSILRL